MTDVQRWTEVLDNSDPYNPWPTMRESDTGGFVTISDHTRLMAEKDAAHAASVDEAVAQARYDWSKVENIYKRAEPHARSCRLFYVEQRCSCGVAADPRSPHNFDPDAHLGTRCRTCGLSNAEPRHHTADGIPVEPLIALVRKLKEIAVVIDAPQSLSDFRDVEKQLMALRSPRPNEFDGDDAS